MAQRIGLVMNPRSRYLRRHPAAIGRLQTQLAGRGLVAESQDLDHIKRVAEDFKKAHVDIVAVAGGDGTAGITIAAFHDVFGDDLPAFAMLRGGTMNTVSNALHLPRGTPEKNLARLLAKTSNGVAPTTSARATLRADGRVGFLFGTGVFASFLREYYKRGKDDPSAVTAAETIGIMAASALVQGPLIKKLATPDTLVLEVDGQRFTTDQYRPLSPTASARVASSPPGAQATARKARPAKTGSASTGRRRSASTSTRVPAAPSVVVA